MTFLAYSLQLKWKINFYSDISTEFPRQFRKTFFRDSPKSSTRRKILYTVENYTLCNYFGLLLRDVKQNAKMRK